MEFAPSSILLLINLSLISLLLTLGVSALLMVGGKKIFEKAKKNVSNVYYPIINLFVLLDIVDLSSFFGILFFVPLINIVIIGYMFYKLGSVFNTNTLNKWGLALFPIYFYPVLCYGNYRYKISDEEYFKGLDNAKTENINLMTSDDIKKLNQEADDPKDKVDSVFKSDEELIEPSGPYKAEELDIPIVEDNSDVITEDPLKPIEKIEVVETDIKKNDNQENKTNVEYVDL